VSITRNRAWGDSTVEEVTADRGYLTLRDRIVTLQLPPGTPIRQSALCADLGVGRTSLRETIRRLAVENLVTVVPGRGSFVSEVTPADLNHVSDVRAQLETYAAGRASAGLAQSERAELDSLLVEIEMRHRGDDPGSLIQLDARVHRFIHRCARNPYLETTLGYYLRLSMRMWYLILDRLPPLITYTREHCDLLRAIETGDSSRAQMLAHEHVVTFERRIHRLL
jgi:DNA-binding GntR family transcriptional regulator